jgi:hypothetical protein
MYNAAADGNGVFTVADYARPMVEDYTGTSKALKQAQAALKSTNEENTRRRHATSKVEGLVKELGLTVDDTDPESIVTALKSHLDELQSNVKNGKEHQINIENVKKALKTAHEDAMRAKDAEVSKLTKAISNHMIRQAATQAIAQEKGSVELLLPHIERHAKVVVDGENFAARVVDDNGEIRVNGAAQPLSIEEFVKEMKTKQQFARAFDSEAANGNGARPGASKIPPANLGKGDRSKMTPNELIARGLAKGQATRG